MLQDINEIIIKFNKENPDKKILLFIIAGSHFFDLNTKNSDKDYRGIYLPLNGKESRRGEVTLKTNQEKNTKNNADDVDCNFYSLKKFLTLLGNGDFNMIEMLFAPREKILITSDIYEQLRYLRDSLIPNDISSFLGFIKKEYKRFGVDKNHYGIQVNFINFLKSIRNYYSETLGDHWEEIIEYSKKEDSYLKISSTRNMNKELPAIVIAKRMFQNTVKITYVLDALEENLKRYGHRRRNQALAGMEFKGLYHSMRLIIEAEDLLTTGELHFPFKEDKHNFLKSIKEGDIDADFLFESIDRGIETLHVLEKQTISNQKNVTYLLDKLIFKFYGELEIKSYIPATNQKNRNID